MRVDVLRVLDAADGLVLFTCEAGSAPGRWTGSCPARTGSFHVEFEIPNEITEWTAVAPGAITLSADGSDVRVECEVERIGDDEVVAVRLGTDVVLIEVPHRKPDVGARISFKTPEIRLYPYDL